VARTSNGPRPEYSQWPHPEAHSTWTTAPRSITVASNAATGYRRQDGRFRHTSPLSPRGHKAPFSHWYSKFHLKATETRPGAVCGRTWPRSAKRGPTATQSATDDVAASCIAGTRRRFFAPHSRPGGRRHPFSDEMSPRWSGNHGPSGLMTLPTSTSVLTTARSTVSYSSPVGRMMGNTQSSLSSAPVFSKA